MLDADTRFLPLCRNLSLPPNFRPAEEKPKISTMSGEDAAVHDKSAAVNVVATQHGPKSPKKDTTGHETVEVRSEAESLRKRRPLVNRPCSSDLDNVSQGDNDEQEDKEDNIDNGISIEYVTPSGTGSEIYSRHVPLIPFDELMLIETLPHARLP